MSVPFFLRSVKEEWKGKKRKKNEGFFSLLFLLFRQ